jgi:hypothetical protein
MINQMAIFISGMDDEDRPEYEAKREKYVALARKFMEERGQPNPIYGVYVGHTADYECRDGKREFYLVVVCEFGDFLRERNEGRGLYEFNQVCVPCVNLKQEGKGK